MSVCRYPNNSGYFKEKCSGDEKYNMCYGDDTEFANIDELEEYISKIYKDAIYSGNIKDFFTLGCWENKNNSPFIQDWKKLEEKDPIKCMEGNFKWVSGDGYVLEKKKDSENLKKETYKKINASCSPGYEGEAFIEVDNCENYKVFKEGDPGEYDQFMLSGCKVCDVKYGGNRENKDDKTCYPQCGVLGTTVFEEKNSNKDLQFMDTKIEFEKGEKRAGYCCNAVEGAITLSRIKDTEKPLGSNHLECSVNKCEKDYIKNRRNNKCCKKILNSKEDVEYDCGKNNNTEPFNKEINYCNDGYYNGLDEKGNYICKPCERDENTHSDAEIKCDSNGMNVVIKKESIMKCDLSSKSYYDEENMICKKCPKNKELNENYDKNDPTSEICSCKSDFVYEDTCYECSGNHIEYNDKYPDLNDKKCKCVLDKKLLPENVLPGDCEGKDLYDGDTCNLECVPGYKFTGLQPKCLENTFSISDFKCEPEKTTEQETPTEPEKTTEQEKPTEPEKTTEQENPTEPEMVEKGIEGFMNITINTKRLFLLFILIILILNVI